MYMVESAVLENISDQEVWYNQHVLVSHVEYGKSNWVKQDHVMSRNWIADVRHAKAYHCLDQLFM